MVTGIVDQTVYDAMSDAQLQQHNMLGNPTTFTKFCHIFPPSTNWNLDAEVPGQPKVLSLTPLLQ
jgi:hypothetical protein